MDSEYMKNQGPEVRRDSFGSTEVTPASPALDETSEVVGNVAEVMSETKDSSTVGMHNAGNNKSVGDDSSDAVNGIAQMKARLLENAPKEKLMRRQVEREIKKEINYLRKRAMKMVRAPGKVNYFEMANIVKKMRELSDILDSLVKASVDALKNLWLRFVHGLM